MAEDNTEEFTAYRIYIQVTPNSVQGQAYYVVFNFTDETINYFNERLKAVFYKKLFGECELLYFQRARCKQYQGFCKGLQEPRQERVL